MKEMEIDTTYQNKRRTYKLLLLFAMISIVMIFAGLTSAFVVSKQRPDWIIKMVLPQTFLYSTLVLLLSSITFYLAQKAIKRDDRKQTTLFLLATLALGLVFVYLQFKGFQFLFDQGLVPFGSASKISISFLYVFVFVHIAHLLGGIISLLIVIYNHFKQKYNATQFLGIELSGMYWHFMDFIWIYLFLFFYFFK